LGGAVAEMGSASASSGPQPIIISRLIEKKKKKKKNGKKEWKKA
jgi:hypothetical protein